MTKVFGYARVSTTDQSTAIQEAALKAAGAQVVFSEQVSGTSRDNRRELAKLLGVLGRGDTLIVTRLDRLGRSMLDLANIAHEIASAGSHLRVVEQPIDTSTPTGKAFFGFMATCAEFESDLRRARQAEGIAKAKTDGVYTGRQQTIDTERIRELQAQGLGPTAIAKSIGISRQSVYRLSAVKDPS
jgi:DNA invertase Pin-like site-specific DNA recombinase